MREWTSSTRADFIVYRDLDLSITKSAFTKNMPWQLFVKEGQDVFLDWKITMNTVVLERLRQGSKRYLAKLKQGRFQNLLIRDLILPAFQTKDAFLETTAELNDGEELPIEHLLQHLWQKPNKRHFILRGEGGTGKTVSLDSFLGKIR